ncbi:MAG: cellulase family glycosylhydrolase [Verrucomicrobiota bacterium]
MAVLVVSTSYLFGVASARADNGEIQLRTSREIPASIFGTGTHFGQSANYKEILPRVEKVGYKWIRDEVYWNKVEKEKGVLVLPENAEAWINDARSRKLSIMLVLGYGNKFYPAEDFEAFKKGYANYCAFMAKALKGRVQVWELWNEPSNSFRKSFGGAWNAKPAEGEKISPWLDKFTDLVIAGARAIRKADPDAIIITNPDNPAAHYFLDALEERDGVDFFDGISIHPYSYRTPPEVRPVGGASLNGRDGVVVADDDHSYASELRLLREKMRSVGMNPANLYATEFGYTTFHRRAGLYEGVSYAAQAKYLARQLILQLAYEIPVAIQYGVQDDHADLTSEHGNFGLFRHGRYDYAPKPSFFAVQRVCSLFSSPVELYMPNWAVGVVPDRYPDETGKHHLVWDNQELRFLNRVETHLFRNPETGEVMLVLWNAVKCSDRQHLLSDVTLDTDAYSEFSGWDILTGEEVALNVSKTDGKTMFKNVVIPDYPLVIRMLLP